jgi:hypothetical protein
MIRIIRPRSALLGPDHRPGTVHAELIAGHDHRRAAGTDQVTISGPKRSVACSKGGLHAQPRRGLSATAYVQLLQDIMHMVLDGG